jgi:hypothetical protein
MGSAWSMRACMSGIGRCHELACIIMGATGSRHGDHSRRPCGTWMTPECTRDQHRCITEFKKLFTIYFCFPCNLLQKQSLGVLRIFTFVFQM